MYEIRNDVLHKPYRTPTRTVEQLALLDEGAASDATLKMASSNIHAEYYLENSKFEGKEYDEQIKYLSKLISRIRRSNSPQNI